MEKISVKDQLLKYKPLMERMFYVLLVVNVVYLTMMATPMVSSFVEWCGVRMPWASVDLVILIFQSIANIRLLVAIPAVYAIIVLMTDKREKLLAAFLLLLGWFYAMYMRKWDDTYILTSVVLIVAAYGKDYRKIAKYTMISVCAVVTLSAVLYLCGILPAVYDLERDGKVRRTFGMIGPTAIAGYMCGVIMILIFLRDGLLKWFDYLLIIVLTVLNLLYVDGRAALFTVALATGGCIVRGIVKSGKIAISEKIMNWIGRLLCLSYVIITGLFFLGVLTYREDRFAFLQKIPVLSTFAGRLEVPHRIMQVLPFSFFGNYMGTYAYAEHNYFPEGEYLFLDSSYARMYLIYGFVGIIFCVGLFTAIQWKLLKAKEIFRMYILAVSALFFFIQKGILDPGFNIFPLLLWAEIQGLKEKEEPSPKKQEKEEAADVEA